MGAYITRAMRSFALWVSRRPYRLVLLTIGFVRLLAPVSAALLVLDALRRGPRSAAISTAAALLGVLLLAVLLRSNIVETLGLTAPILIGGAASGALLWWSRSLSLAFQGTVIGFIVATLVVFTVAPGAGQIGALLREELLALLQTGGASEAQIATFADLGPAQYVRFLLSTLLLSLTSALLLGFWWYALIAEGVRFGEEFRALKLGRFAGIALMVLVVLGQLVEVDLLRNLAWLAVVAFLFQGLAVMHARSHSDQWPRGIVAFAYVVLVIPWTTPVALMALCAVGLIDNVFELRARAKPHD